MLGGKYPVISGLEHDEWGHPTSSPKLHTQMTARRRDKLKRLAEELPLPEIHGDKTGETLIIAWGSPYGTVREATDKLRSQGRKIGCLNMRHMHPMPNGFEKLFAGYEKVVVAEINDEGLYGQGQLATLLRSRYCDPKIKSVTKTDGLSFQVREIIAGVERA